MPTVDETVEILLDRHGRTFADEMGIRLRGHRDDLFQLLVGALLMSARIDAGIAVGAARALFARGYTTPERMLGASWQDRVDALGEGHYVRYDESTASYLANTSNLLLDEYDGDLRRLRAAADGDVGAIRGRLEDGKGIGPLGAGIFLREVQAVWDEVYPFADDATLGPARALGLGSDPEELANLVPRPDLPRLVAALVRADLEDDLDAVRNGAADAPLTDTQIARMTKRELYDVAKRREIAGRSGMSRGELVEALRDA